MVLSHLARVHRFFPAAAALALAAQDPGVLFRAGVSVVSVDAQVTSGGRPVTGLQKEDFVIADRGKVQPILYFGMEEEPLDLVLLLDTSGSMRPAAQEVARAARRALEALHPGDRVAVMLFKSGRALALPYRPDLGKLPGELARIVGGDDFEGGTDLYGGLMDAAAYVLAESRANARRAILAVTDNISRKSRKESEVSNALWRAGTVLDALVVPTRRGQALRAYPNVNGPWTQFIDTRLDKIAAMTGGEILEGEAPGEAFTTLVERIRKRYRLDYRTPPGKAGEVRKIEVSLSAAAKAKYPSAEVRARKGYILAETVPRN
jgi:VWFA-related protein